MNYKALFTLLLFIACFGLSAQKKKEASFEEFQAGKKKYIEDLYNLALKKNDSLLLAEAYYLKGKLAEPVNHKKAAEWFLKSLKILEPRGPSFELGRLYVKLGVVARAAQNEPQGQSYDEKARETFILAKSERGFNQYFGLFGEHLSIWIKKPDELNKNLASRILWESASQLSENLLNDTAVNNLKKAVAFYETQKADTRITYLRGLLDLTNYYMRIKNYSEAGKTLYKAKGIEREYFQNDMDIKMYSLFTQYEYYKATKNWEKAHAALLEIKTIEDKKKKEEGMAQIHQLELEYETEKKDKLLSLKEMEVSSQKKLVLLQKKYLTGATIMILLLTGLGAYLFRLFRVNKRLSNKNKLLLAEQNHRVKNNLQAISSLLSLQSHDLEDSRALHAFNESQLRVEAMAILHRKLYDNKNPGYVLLSDFIDEITESVLTTYGYSSVRVNTEVDLIYLSADKAVHLGLIFNELITNSCKYAFLLHPEPILSISCKKMMPKNKNYISIQVSDNGISGNTHTSGKGFGMQLIEMEVLQLYGEFDFSYDHGTTFRMKFCE